MSPEGSPDSPLLNVVGVSKQFPGVLALNEVSLSVGRGEVLAVIGENGAGKSTLMKILAGIQTPDSGRIEVDGRPEEITSVNRALALGISLIHQELNLADNLDIGANIFLGREPHRMSFIARREIYARSAEILRALRLDVSPKTLVSKLSIGHQQLVEIAKAMSTNARVLIMDEPTSSLSQHETEQLYEVIRELSGQGVSIVYISHRLSEVKYLADRVVVLRDGANAGALAKDEISHERMVQLMVGREVDSARKRTPLEPGALALEVSDFATAAWPKARVNFSVREKEIVGVAGLVGSGRSELLQSIFGVLPRLQGTVRVLGEEARLQSPVDALGSRLALLPEDRKQQGLLLETSVRENIGLADLRRASRRGFVDRARERRVSKEMVERLNIRTPNDRQRVQLLSGGNQQKVVLGKWLATDPKVFLLDEPTRGIDVGAKREIYLLMEQLAERGAAVLFVSSELEEILTLSDRVLVMHDGNIAGELGHDQLTEEAVMRLATGGAAVAA